MTGPSLARDLILVGVVGFGLAGGCSYYAATPAAPAKPVVEAGDTAVEVANHFGYAELPQPAGGGEEGPPPRSAEEQAAVAVWNTVIKDALSDNNKNRPGEVIASSKLGELRSKLAAIKGDGRVRAQAMAEVLDASARYSQQRAQPDALAAYWRRVDRAAAALDPAQASDARSLPLHAILIVAELASGREADADSDLAPLMETETHRARVMAEAQAFGFPAQPGEQQAAYFERLCKGPLASRCQGFSADAYPLAVEMAILERVGQVTKTAAERCGECAAKNTLWWDYKRPTGIATTLTAAAKRGESGEFFIATDVRRALPGSRSARALVPRHLVEIDENEVRLDNMKVAGVRRGAIDADTARADDQGGAISGLSERLPGLEQTDAQDNIPTPRRSAVNLAARRDTPASLLLETAFAAGMGQRKWLRLVVSDKRSGNLRETPAFTLASDGVAGCKPLKSILKRPKACAVITSSGGKAVGPMAALVVVTPRDLLLAEGKRGRPRPVNDATLARRRGSWRGGTVVVAVDGRATIERVVNVLDQLAGDNDEPTLVLASWR